jgi:hypothetical protein
MLKYLIILTLSLYCYLTFKDNKFNKEFYIISIATITCLIIFSKKTICNKKKVNNNKTPTYIDNNLIYKNESNNKDAEETYHYFIDNLDKCGVHNSEDVPIILFKICLEVGYVYKNEYLYHIDTSKINSLNTRIIQILNNDLIKKRITNLYPQCILDYLYIYLNNLPEFLDLFNKEILNNYDDMYKQLENKNNYYFYYYIEPEVVDIETEEIIENFSNKQISFGIKFK